jgi:hypothetical protein
MSFAVKFSWVISHVRSELKTNVSETAVIDRDDGERMSL